MILIKITCFSFIGKTFQLYSHNLIALFEQAKKPGLAAHIQTHRFPDRILPRYKIFWLFWGRGELVFIFKIVIILCLLKKLCLAPPSMVQLVGASSCKSKGCVGSIPSQGTWPICGFDPWLVYVLEATHPCFSFMFHSPSLPLFPSFPPSLEAMKNVLRIKKNLVLTLKDSLY